MEAQPVVQVLLKGELLQTVPIVGDVLRIGRMQENELVINNRSISRFHAVLRRNGVGWIVEDLGSENGTHVNGTRIDTPTPVAPGDDLRIGRHVLVLRSSGPEMQLPLAVGAHHEALVSGAEAVGLGPVDSAAEPSRETEPLVHADRPESRAMRSNEAEPEAAMGSSNGAAPSTGEHTALFDFAMDADLARSDPGAAMDLDPLPRPSSSGPVVMDTAQPDLPMAPVGPELHAGLIVQRGGTLERVFAWDQDRICVGRARECEVLLASRNVSRRHALFIREGERHEVRDLDSTSGLFVNGERVLAHALEVGDIVRIEDFELTFVLDAQPIGEVVQMDRDTQASADSSAVTELRSQAPSRPPVEPPQTDPGLSMPPNLMTTDPMPEIDLLGEDEGEEEEKDLEATPSPASAVQEAPTVVALASGQAEAPVTDARAAAAMAVTEEREPAPPVSPVVDELPVVLELRLPIARVPEVVRRWLEEVVGSDGGELRLPVEVSLGDEEGG